MLRGIRTVVALAAIVLLARPLDCFSAAKLDPKAVDCCKKGKCRPSNNDDCCKATVQGGDELLASRNTDYPTLALDFVVADIVWFSPLPSLVTPAFARVHAPPESPPGERLSLPLLI